MNLEDMSLDECLEKASELGETIYKSGADSAAIYLYCKIQARMIERGIPTLDTDRVEKYIAKVVDNILDGREWENAETT